MRYYMDMVERKKYSVDHTQLREYFPIQRVLSGMFDIYQRLLGVTFTKIAEPPVWHEDVTMVSLNWCLGYFS